MPNENDRAEQNLALINKVLDKITRDPESKSKDDSDIIDSIDIEAITGASLFQEDESGGYKYEDDALPHKNKVAYQDSDNNDSEKNTEEKELLIESVSDLLDKEEIGSINTELKKLDTTVSAIISTIKGIKSGGFDDSTEEILIEQSINGLSGSVSKINRNIAKILVGNIIEQENNRSDRPLETLYLAKENTKKTSNDIMRYCHPLPQSESDKGTSRYSFADISECEFDDGEVLFSVIKSVDPREMASKMKVSQTVFSPILEAYRDVFDKNIDFSSILSDFDDVPVYSDEVVKMF